MDIQNIIDSFCFDGEFIAAREFGAGHINTTMMAEFTRGCYVLQRINTAVFHNPDALMDNIFGVTDFLREKIAASGGDPERETLHFIKTKDGKKYFRASDGACFRAYRFVDNSVCYNQADSTALLQKSGAAFGRFLRMLADYPADTLTETIPHFHDTPWRFHHEFTPAVQRDISGRAAQCRAEIAFIRERESRLYRITNALADGSVPLRVTHNDTKLNNILFDKDTGAALAVIDLDTVMPGSALYDFGDAIRFGAATAGEDERENISVSLPLFEAYAAGYLSEAGETLTETEKALLPYAAWLITLECGMRFLTDYLNGDTYFKTDYAAHNLVRARNQLLLAADMEAKTEAMEKIIKALV